MFSPFSILCTLTGLLAMCSSSALAMPRLVGWVGESNPSTPSTVWLGGGYFSGKGWRSDAAAKSALYPGTRWQLFGLNGVGPSVTTGAVLPPDMPEGVTAAVRAPVSIPRPMIAVSNASAKAQPRLPRVQSLNQPLYQNIAAELLRARGLKVKSARLTQLLRVDLNGDGVEEVLLSARSRPEYGKTPEERKGDYSLLALRYVVGNQVKNVVLDATVSPGAVAFSAPSNFEFMAFVDVNDDGRMEIVGQSSYYEGWGIGVWQFDGRTVRRVVDAGWGV